MHPKKRNAAKGAVQSQIQMGVEITHLPLDPVASTLTNFAMTLGSMPNATSLC